MGNIGSWLSGCLYPDEQALWHAATNGDHRGLRDAIARLTPETRRYLEWRDSCSGRTPLAQAAAKGRIECARALVEADVNVNAKDFKGNSPLHLACRYGHDQVVKYLVHLVAVVPFEVNMRLKTPLDIARERLGRRRDEGECPTTAKSSAYEACIVELEQKFYIYSGWLYEKTDNLLSSVSGLSNLSSWKHRYCLVLQRGLPDVLELALFSQKRGQPRPALPKSVILYHVQTGITETADDKWFNRKNYAFRVKGSVLLRDGCCEQRGRQAAATQTVEFAATDGASLDMWRSFFAHHQEMLAVSQRQSMPYQARVPTVVATHPAPPPVPAYQTQPASDISLYPAERGCTPHTRSATSSQTSVATTMSLLQDEDEDEAQLRRAIELSLLDAGGRPSSQTESLYPPLPITTSSAPVWTDDEADALSGSYTGRSAVSSPSEAQTTSADPPVVTFSRAPVNTSIGECVVCFDGPQAAVCVPCGHNAVCMTCAEEILETSCECPVCRQPIRELIKLYKV